MRELHGIEAVDPEAWEGVTVRDYTAHLDHLVAKVKAGAPWVEGPSTVDRYQLARSASTCALPTAQAPRTLHFSQPSPACSRVTTTLTYAISVTRDPLAPPLTATQAGASVTVRFASPAHYLVDADPTKGDVTLSL